MGAGKDKRGKLVEWVEKASFDRSNRLFEIAAVERSCETLFSAQNLSLVTQEPQPYVLNILPRRLPKKVVSGEHFVLKDLSFYTAVRKVDARARKARLNEREEKRLEGTLQKAPGDKRPASSPPVGAPAKKKKKKVLNKGKEIKLPIPPKKVVIPPLTFVEENVRSLRPALCFKRLQTSRGSKRIGAISASFCTDGSSG